MAERKRTAMRSRRSSKKDPLEQKAAQVERMIEDVRETAFSGDVREVSGEVSVVDQHDADVAAVVYGREEQETVRQVLEREAAQIEDARRKKADGTYGICEDCGRPIPPERLRALPEATRCVECQRRSEASRRGA